MPPRRTSLADTLRCLCRVIRAILVAGTVPFSPTHAPESFRIGTGICYPIGKLGR